MYFSISINICNKQKAGMISIKNTKSILAHMNVRKKNIKTVEYICIILSVMVILNSNIL